VVLPLVPFDQQLRFYQEILPGFSTGHYHGLRVPLSLPANHSIPDLFNQLWPGPDQHSLSAPARSASACISGLSLLALTLLARRVRTGDTLSRAAVLAAFTCLLVIWPAYTYEHHLALLVFPAATLLTAWGEQRAGLPKVLALAGILLTAFPLGWLRAIQDGLAAVPGATWLLQESKFVGIIALALANIRIALPPAEARQ
jgi:hypothetical protein